MWCLIPPLWDKQFTNMFTQGEMVQTSTEHLIYCDNWNKIAFSVSISKANTFGLVKRLS